MLGAECRRQELQAALAQAQEAAAEEADEAEFQRASAAVSRLTQTFSPARVLQQSALAVRASESSNVSHRACYTARSYIILTFFSLPISIKFVSLDDLHCTKSLCTARRHIGRSG